MHKPSHARAVAAAVGVDTAVQSHYIKFRVAHLRKAQAEEEESAIDILKKERRSFNCPSCKTRLSNPCEKLASLYRANKAPICPTCKIKVPFSAIMPQEEWASLLLKLGFKAPATQAAQIKAPGVPQRQGQAAPPSLFQAWLARQPKSTVVTLTVLSVVAFWFGACVLLVFLGQENLFSGGGIFAIIVMLVMMGIAGSIIAYFAKAKTKSPPIPE